MLADIVHVFFGPSIRFAPTYFAAFLLTAFFIFLFQRGRDGSPGFIGWLFPRSVYFHRSHLTDIKLFVVGRLLALTGALSTIAVRTVLATVVAAALAASTGAEIKAGHWSTSIMLTVTLSIFLLSDFAAYWTHRLHHETSVLWPFHAVHHSAEVLTPVTVYRKHPVYDLIGGLIQNILFGVGIGVLLFLVTDRIDALTLGGINAGYYLFNIAGANFRHTHIWIGYGRVLEHVLISPAQHQIHHSRALKHHNRNYGEVFAIWDWMFGTLYITRGREALDYGLADEKGVAIPQPHGTLRNALLVPFRDSFAALRPSARRPAETDTAGEGVPQQ